MAKKILVDAIAAQVKMDGVTVVEGGKFGTAIRNMDAGDRLAEGETIEIPEEYQVLATKLSDAEDAQAVPFIMVTIINKDGAERASRFFPNSLAKVVFPVDENGKRLPKVKTTGTAAVWYSKQQDVDAAMEALKGKKIKVIKETMYQAPGFNNGPIRNTYIYQYDLVD